MIPEQLAKLVVKKVINRVNHIVRSSTVIDGDQEKDDGLAIFERSELKLGNLIGSGGFSDVYEISDFSSSEESESEQDWTSQQQSVRKSFEGDVLDESGASKYVVKRLKIKMMQNEKKFFMAASDLALEAQYLSSLDHKHILKIRGWAAGGLKAFSNGEYTSYFLVLDRLQDTLDNRLKIWREEIEEKEKIQSSDPKSDLLSRAKVAFQVASAIKYLHSKRIIFRDLKPNNVGFDSFGDVKLFDFGLARELPESGKTNEIYCMSGKVGTLRYMAPEVARREAYNQKADVYSWSILFWTCLNLSLAYEKMLKKDHLRDVCELGERPEIQSTWPKSVRNLLMKSWAHNPRNRLSMKEVLSHVQRIERDLSPKSESRFRSLFMPPSFIQPKSNTLAPNAA